MFGKIYRKLYVWFLIIFILTVAAVSILIHLFYTERVRDEVQEQLQSHARFLISEYEVACKDRESRTCGEFLERLTQISPVRFWILNPSGQVLFSNQKSRQPLLKNRELARAVRGETVVSMRHRAPAYVVLPLQKADGSVREIALIERGFFGGRRFPRFPFLAALGIVLITIGILIFPLSKRLTRPVRDLHQMGQEWAEGRLEKRALVRGNDEISELAGAFNTMAEKLQKMLEQRKEFLAWISHELKSPLARMRIALELLSDRSQGEKETEKLIGSIQQEISESERLIEQLLLLSRIEMNAPFESETVELEKASGRAVQQVEPLAAHARVSFQSAGGASVTGDFYQLERAMMNVLENAVKFSQPEDVIRIEMGQDHGNVYWKCTDQGSGIAPAEVNKIFQPFFRGENAGSKQGSGLGLFIARRIVEMHRGTIHAEPNQPKGVTIVMRFPSNQPAA